MIELGAQNIEVRPAVEAVELPVPPENVVIELAPADVIIAFTPVTPYPTGPPEAS